GRAGQPYAAGPRAPGEIAVDGADGYLAGTARRTGTAIGASAAGRLEHAGAHLVEDLVIALAHAVVPHGRRAVLQIKLHTGGHAQAAFGRPGQDRIIVIEVFPFTSGA